MNYFERHALLASLINQMQDNKSWTGRTHIQKSVYFLQNLLNVPLKLPFLLYKYGPYSFELDAELQEMYNYGALQFDSIPSTYGSGYMLGPSSKDLLKRFGKYVKKHKNEINFVASKISPRGIFELERLGTAMYVSTTPEEVKWNKTKKQRIKRICQLKPHLKSNEVQEALDEFEEIRKEWKNLR